MTTITLQSSSTISVTTGPLRAAATTPAPSTVATVDKQVQAVAAATKEAHTKASPTQLRRMAFKAALLKNHQARRVTTAFSISERLRGHERMILEILNGLHSTNEKEHQAARKDPRIHFAAGGLSTVFTITGIAGLIFKTDRYRMSSEFFVARYRDSQTVRKVCEEQHLHNLIVPVTEVIEKLDGTPVNLLVEELLDIPPNESRMGELMEFCSQDTEMSEILNKYVAQLAVLIVKTGLWDIRLNNVPLLMDGSGIGIVDPEHLNITEVFRGLSGLIGCTYPPQYAAIQKVVQDIAPELNGRIQRRCDEATEEWNDRKELDAFHASRGIVEGDEPLNVDFTRLQYVGFDSRFDTPDPNDQEQFKLVVEAIDRQIAAKSAYPRRRRRFLLLDLKATTANHHHLFTHLFESTDPQYRKDSRIIYRVRMILRELKEKGYIFGVISQYSDTQATFQC